jgi:hypothetical protein
MNNEDVATIGIFVFFDIPVLIMLIIAIIA